MIVNCQNCNKNFIVKDSLIPNEGKLVECGNCKNRWFFKPLEGSESINLIKDEILISDSNKQSKSPNDEKNISIKINDNNDDKKIKDWNDKKNNKSEKDLLKKSLNVFFIILISFAAIILIFDTFKLSISIYLPGLIPMLDNLYITINDLQLFVIDLFN